MRVLIFSWKCFTAALPPSQRAPSVGSEPAPHGRGRGDTERPGSGAVCLGEFNGEGPGRLRKTLLATAPADPTAPGQSPMTVVIIIVIIIIIGATIEVRCKSWGLFPLNPGPRRSLPSHWVCEEAIYSPRRDRSCLRSPAPPPRPASEPAAPAAAQRIDPAPLKLGISRWGSQNTNGGSS